MDVHLSSDGLWFSGLILRGCDGSVVGAATWLHVGNNDAVVGEAWGLNDALDWIDKFYLSNVIIELENQTVVNAVKRRARIRKSWGARIFF
ncbi:hypothetical protein A2U01_0029195 [Trifolium medium]|uniref:RNase H type-1 domain-containing protein n=1 Tax=Trifolium medium TaxID=97028 RepID=A0A392P8Q6_9FABA|nr:hypothetical protein [Trifolium medium]